MGQRTRQAGLVDWFGRDYQSRGKFIANSAQPVPVSISSADRLQAWQSSRNREARVFDRSPYRHVFAQSTTERPLTTHLWRRAEPRRYVHEAGRRVLTEDHRALASELAGQIVRECIDPVRRTEFLTGSWRDDDDSNYRFGASRDVPSFPSVWIAAQIEGDVEMLLHYPDSALQRGVAPLSERPRSGTADGYHRDAYWMLPTTFDKSPFGPDSGPYIWTEVILPRDVYDGLADVSPDARLSALLTRHFTERLDVLLAEVARTVAEWSKDVADGLIEAIDARATVLRRREIADEGLSFLPRWQPQPAQLDTKVEPATAPTLGASAQLTTERLSAKSFADFLAVTRKWAEPLSRSPRSFRSLPEEDLSGLLAATLNACFPFAGQEVFSYEGKTDIFVRADHLNGAAPEKVFILENHWWDGPGLLHQKLDQLLGYCTVRDTEAILMAMIRERIDMPDVPQALLSHRASPVVLTEECGYPTFQVVSNGKAMRVALIALDLRSL